MLYGSIPQMHTCIDPDLQRSAFVTLGHVVAEWFCFRRGGRGGHGGRL